MLPDGVFHWTAKHPEWDGPDVSAYAIDDGKHLLLIDPIAVPAKVDALADEREAVVVLTCPWHERDARTIAAKHGARVYAPPPDRPAEELVAAEIYRAGDRLPFGIEAFPGREEPFDLVLWVERIRAILAGDTLVSFTAGLEIPERWLPDGVTVEQVAAGLRPLLDKPIEVVLPTHGQPTDRAAFERALGG